MRRQHAARPDSAVLDAVERLAPLAEAERLSHEKHVARLSLKSRIAVAGASADAAPPVQMPRPTACRHVLDLGQTAGHDRATEVQ